TTALSCLKNEGLQDSGRPILCRQLPESYLRDRQTNWFLNLDRDTAASLNRQELQRFYVALMNAGYLSSLYLISQLPSDSEDPASQEELLPPDVLRLIRNHRYTAQYKSRSVN